MANNALSQYPIEQVLNIDFIKMINRDVDLEEQIRKFVKDKDFKLIFKLNSIKKLEHQSDNKYHKLAQKEFDTVMAELPFLKF